MKDLRQKVNDRARELEGLESDFINQIKLNIKINEIIDSDGYTLLHIATFQNKTEIVMNLLEIGKKDLEPFEITEWVNLSTSKDKFTALHYASFRGNIELLDLLINYGADQKAKNEFGLNVMHIAA